MDLQLTTFKDILVIHLFIDLFLDIKIGYRFQRYHYLNKKKVL